MIIIASIDMIRIQIQTFPPTPTAIPARSLAGHCAIRISSSRVCAIRTSIILVTPPHRTGVYTQGFVFSLNLKWKAFRREVPSWAAMAAMMMQVQLPELHAEQSVWFRRVRIAFGTLSVALIGYVYQRRHNVLLIELFHSVYNMRPS